MSAIKPFPNLPNPRLWARIGGKHLAFREVVPTTDKSQHLVSEVQLSDLVIQPKG